jgi:uncharacterized protein GlcG (DUF336 family)
MMTRVSSIGEASAQAALAFGVKQAAARRISICIAIVDSGRNLVGFLRMSGTPLGAIEVSQGKAYTSASVNMKTGELAKYVQPGTAFYGFEVSHRQPLVVFGGGVPVDRDGVLIGAVGVSGGSMDDDVSLAEAVAAFLAQRPD